MAYTTGSATNLDDLLDKLNTFMTGTPSTSIVGGWVRDDVNLGVADAAQGYMIWSKGTLNIGVKWVHNAPNNMSIHQATAYAASGFPGAQTNDSGNGYNAAFGTDAALEGERCVNTIGDGPFESYHFFGDATLNYVHVVVQTESEVFRHFGFGDLEKFNDWTGGEYCYGHWQYETVGTNSHAIYGKTTCFLDGLFDDTTNGFRAATVRATGLPHQGGSEMWLQCLGGVNPATWDPTDFPDTATFDKQQCSGGFRAGPVAWPLGQWRSDVATGHIPMYQFAVFTMGTVTATLSAYFLGNVPDIRGIEIFNFAAEQEVTIGSDTWVIFPMARRTADNVLNRTYYGGVAYRKVT